MGLLTYHWVQIRLSTKKEIIDYLDPNQKKKRTFPHITHCRCVGKVTFFSQCMHHALSPEHPISSALPDTPTVTRPTPQGGLVVHTTAEHMDIFHMSVYNLFRLILASFRLRACSLRPLRSLQLLRVHPVTRSQVLGNVASVLFYLHHYHSYMDYQFPPQ